MRSLMHRALLERLKSRYGQAVKLDERDRALAARMLHVGDNAAIIAVGDARFVVVYGDGSEELHDIKAPIR